MTQPRPIRVASAAMVLALVAGAAAANCDMFMRVQGGRFVRVDPPAKGYVCNAAIHRR